MVGGLSLVGWITGDCGVRGVAWLPELGSRSQGATAVRQRSQSGPAAQRQDEANPGDSRLVVATFRCAPSRFPLHVWLASAMWYREAEEQNRLLFNGAMDPHDQGLAR